MLQIVVPVLLLPAAISICLFGDAYHQSVYDQELSALKSQQITIGHKVVSEFQGYLATLDDEMRNLGVKLQKQPQTPDLLQRFKSGFQDELVYRNILLFNTAGAITSKLNDDVEIEVNAKTIVEGIKESLEPQLFHQNDAIILPFPSATPEEFFVLYAALNTRYLATNAFNEAFYRTSNRPTDSKLYFVLNPHPELELELSKTASFTKDEIGLMLPAMENKKEFIDPLGDRLILIFHDDVFSYIATAPTLALTTKRDEAAKNVYIAASVSYLLCGALWWFAIRKLYAGVRQVKEDLTRLLAQEKLIPIVYHGQDEMGAITSKINELFDKAQKQSELMEARLKELQAGLERRNLAFKDILQARETLFEQFAEQLKSALKNFSYYVTVVADKESPPDKQELFLKYISTEVEKTHALVNDMAYFRSLENMDPRANVEQVNIQELIQELQTAAAEKIQAKNLAITAKFPDPPPLVEGNREYIKRVFSVLFDNAIKFSNAEGKILVGAKIQNDYGIFFFQDKGRGITKDAQPNIFNIFFKEDEKEDGAGLGLPIAQKIAAKYGGRLLCKSEPGEGSTFILELPLALNTSEKTDSATGDAAPQA